MVVIDAPDGPSSPVTLALEQPDESSLELFAGAWVDDGVHTAVEVTQPEDDLEDNFGGLQRWEERTLEEIKRNMVRRWGRVRQQKVARVVVSPVWKRQEKAEGVALQLGPCLAMSLPSE